MTSTVRADSTPGLLILSNRKVEGSKESGAGDGIRTRNPQLGKLMRYRCATPALSKSHRLARLVKPWSMSRS